MRNKKNISLVSFFIIVLSVFSNYSIASENETEHAASQAVGFSGGWISGNGITYRRYFGNYFVQGTFFGIVSNNADTAYVNTAISGGSYLHKLKSVGIIPPLGLKILAGADLVIEKQREGIAYASQPGGAKERSYYENKSFYGAGVGIDIGNPGRAGLSLWIAVNYVFAFEGITSPKFDWFGARPSAGILYGW